MYNKNVGNMQQLSVITIRHTHIKKSLCNLTVNYEILDISIRKFKNKPERLMNYLIAILYIYVCLPNMTFLLYIVRTNRNGWECYNVNTISTYNENCKKARKRKKLIIHFTSH